MTSAVLESPVIQDTMFGSPRAARQVENSGPDSSCLCACACETREVKLTTNQLNSAAAWSGGAPQP
jgi:hypothetical protein